MSFVSGMPCPFYCYCNDGGDGGEIGGRWLIYIKVRVGWTGGGYHLILFVFFLCFCILLSQILSPFIKVART